MDKLPDLESSFEFAACGLATTEINGTICRVNATFCKWIGFSANELIGQKKIQELFSVGGRFFHQTHLAPLIEMQGFVTEIQIDLVSNDGFTIPTLMNAIRCPHGEKRFDEFAFIAAADRKSYERELISARKTAEELIQSLYATQKELRESQDILRIAVRSARMGIWSLNLHKDEVWLSPEFEEITGLSQTTGRCLRDDLHQLIHQEDRESFIAQVNTAILAKSSYEIEFRLQHANGGWLTMQGRGHAVYSEIGEALSIFGIVIDISERKTAEEQLHNLNQQLCIANSRKDEFLATLAHELRNPLVPMRNVLEIMRHKENGDPFLLWSSDVIERHVLQLTRLVDDLIEVSRISHERLQLRKQRVDLCGLVRREMDASEALMCEAKLTLTRIIPQQPIFIDADPTRIAQIIFNLLNNAAKYTQEGGFVQLNLYQDDGEAVVSVRDSGMGIPPEQLDSVFTVFSQLTPAPELAQGGLGIGLLLVKGLVSLHGGSVIAYSEGVGKGSEFIVRLPMPRTAIESIAPLKASGHAQANRKRILVIDDNIDAAESLVLLLKLSGYATDCAFDGATGLAAAEKFCPDAILLDIGLPDIDGYEVARRTRQQPWGEKVFLIAATRRGEEIDKALAADAGFNAHLIKPINYQQLKNMLENVFL